MYSGECYKTASGNQAYNDDDEEFLLKKIDVTKPQAVIWPSTIATIVTIAHLSKKLQNRKR